MSLRESIKNIADAIRDKTGKTDTMTIDEMPAEIGSISGGGGGGPSVYDLLYKDTSIVLDIEHIDPSVTPNRTTKTIGQSFRWSNMNNLSFPNLIDIKGNDIFANTTATSNVEFPELTQIGIPGMSNANPQTIKTFNGINYGLIMPKLTDVYINTQSYSDAVITLSVNSVPIIYAPNCMFHGYGAASATKTQGTFLYITSKSNVPAVIDIKGWDPMPTSNNYPIIYVPGTAAVTFPEMAIHRTDMMQPITNYSLRNVIITNLYVPDELVADYQADPIWPTKATNILPMSSRS